MCALLLIVLWKHFYCIAVNLHLFFLMCCIVVFAAHFSNVLHCGLWDEEATSTETCDHQNVPQLWVTTSPVLRSTSHSATQLKPLSSSTNLLSFIHQLPPLFTHPPPQPPFSSSCNLNPTFLRPLTSTPLSFIHRLQSLFLIKQHQSPFPILPSPLQI